MASLGHDVVLGTSRSNLRSLDCLASFATASLDWADGGALAMACRGCDAVIDAAGMNAQNCAANPVEALEFNGVATARLVQPAAGVGIRRFIYLSTALVSCAPLTRTTTQNTSPTYL